MRYKSHDALIQHIQEYNPCQPEYIQAVSELMESLWPFIAENPHYAEQGLLDRLIEAERIIQFRIAWVDDNGDVQVNRGFRVQHNSALGPYKGGIRFHPSVDLSIFKFLALEQTLKNALTTMPMGGGKGGSDFNPRKHSANEIMRFCQSFMTEMYRHIGTHTDVPAGDIGVGNREIGYMVGMMKKLANRSDYVFTGKDISIGGSLMRRESTGYGVVYFTDAMLKEASRTIKGMKVAVSGSGNVATHTIEKAMELGAKVITASDSDGTVIDEQGFTPEKLAVLNEIKNNHNGRIIEYAEHFNLPYEAGKKPWHVPVDIAMPCATQNELTVEDARTLIKNGLVCITEGANMPCTAAAIRTFQQNNVLFAPGKAANAGGVATSGLEMSQNSMRLSWSKEEVDQRLQEVMQNIHRMCLKYGKREDGTINYMDGANIAGFVRVADAMLAQGVT